MKSILFLSGLILVLAGCYHPVNPEPSTSNELNIVETEAQKPGDTVTIPRVLLASPGFVMIHESVNGQTGPIVMTGDYLPAGESTDVVVETGRVTRSGEEFFAMLHVDDGNGSYDNPGIDPPIVQGGTIVQESFMIE